MGEKKRRYIERRLLSFPEPVRVLEWGSGTSTVYFTRFLRESGRAYEWTSIEHDKEWYGKLKEELANDVNTTLVLEASPEGDPKDSSTDMEAYISYPSRLDTKFHLIIVDGRRRRRCVLEAKNILETDGEVLLDDAFRPYYWSVLTEYPDSCFLAPSFWRGKSAPPGFFEEIKNIVANAWYKSLCRVLFLWRRARRRMRRALTSKSL